MSEAIILDTLQIIKLKQQVEKVLHVPGSLIGTILEMAIVLDWNMDRQQIQETTVQIMKTLKMHSVVFRNVRLNVVSWKSNSEIMNDVIPIPIMMLGKYFENYTQNDVVKAEDNLVTYLRKFQARSKLIIVITNGKYEIINSKQVDMDMNPFLKRKLIWVTM